MLQALLEQVKAVGWIDWLGMATGILGVWMSIKERVSTWLFFIACYLCYVWLSYQSGFFAFLGMNAVFAGLAVYGLIAWSRGKSPESESLEITRTPRSQWLFIGSFLAFGTVGIGSLLGLMEEAQMPYLDSFAASCGLTAQWMLSRKHYENWLFWLLSNVIYTYIFVQSDWWPSVLLFLVLIVLAIKGWLEWKRKLSA